MRKIMIAALAVMLLLTACGRPQSSDPAPIGAAEGERVLRLAEAAEAEKDGVQLKIDRFEAGVLSIRLINHSGESWYYGESFRLFRRSGEDSWNAIPDDRSWIMIANELMDGGEVHLDLDLSPLTLEPDTYLLARDGFELPFRLIAVLKDSFDR